MILFADYRSIISRISDSYHRKMHGITSSKHAGRVANTRMEIAILPRLHRATVGIPSTTLGVTTLTTAGEPSHNRL